MQQKDQQGDALMLEAKSFVTKGLFRWSEDWNSAAASYEKAAICYKNARQPAKCKNAYLQAGEAYLKLRLWHSASKNFESAAEVAVSLKQPDEAVVLYEKSAAVLAQDDNLEFAAEAQTKAAKLLEETDPARALKLYLDALDTFESADHCDRKASDTIRKALSLVLSNNNFGEALNILERQVKLDNGKSHKNDLYKTYVCIVIIHLALNDYTAADRAYQSFLATEGFPHSQEECVARALLDAFEHADPDGLKDSLSKPIFNFLPNQINRVARNLSVTSGVVRSARRPATGEGGGASSKDGSEKRRSGDDEEHERSDDDDLSLV